MSASTLADQFSTDDPEGQAKLAVTVIVAVIAFCLMDGWQESLALSIRQHQRRERERERERENEYNKRQ